MSVLPKRKGAARCIWQPLSRSGPVVVTLERHAAPRASACLGLVIDVAFAPPTSNRSRPIDTQRVAEPTTPSRSDCGQAEVFPAVPAIPRAADRRLIAT